MVRDFWLVFFGVSGRQLIARLSILWETVGFPWILWETVDWVWILPESVGLLVDSGSSWKPLNFIFKMNILGDCCFSVFTLKDCELATDSVEVCWVCIDFLGDCWLVCSLRILSLVDQFICCGFVGEYWKVSYIWILRQTAGFRIFF